MQQRSRPQSVRSVCLHAHVHLFTHAPARQRRSPSRSCPKKTAIHAGLATRVAVARQLPRILQVTTTCDAGEQDSTMVTGAKAASETPTSAGSNIQVEASDIQAIVLRPRPKPYRGEYVILRVGDAGQGREMLRRILPHVAPAAEWWVPSLPGWLGIAFTFEGLKALGVPQASLDSFPIEFRQGMAARAAILHDLGANAPGNWEHPFGTPDVHVALALYAKDDETLQKVLEFARKAHHDLADISVVYRMQFGELPEGRNPFGFKDGLHNPHVEGSGSVAQAGCEASIKAGEFIMGYPDERGEIANGPIPAELRHNGSFVALRKFHMDVAAFRRYLRAQASSPEEEELLAAKMVGRWRSGAPLVLAPDRDNPELGSDRDSNNVFSYADDMKGLRCPFSAHIRRINPRDALKD